MFNEDRSLSVVFNGEIYNHERLRQQLESSGHIYASSADTETILHGYEEWGVEVLSHLKGMFAFALWDDKLKRMLVARDRFGIKPLFYGHVCGRFVFASEVGPFVKHPFGPMRLSRQSLMDYLVYRVVPTPHCLYEGFSKLEPATYLLVDANTGRIEHKCYWTIPLGNDDRSLDELEVELHDRLSKSVREHFISDVPVGLLLSGGMDSCTLLALASEQGIRPRTFTVGFNGHPRSEHRAARSMANSHSGEHFELMLRNEQLDYSGAAEAYDEPFAGSSCIPTLLLCESVAKHVKVVLGGDGGDELFGGYVWDAEISQMWRNSKRWKWCRSLLPGLVWPRFLRDYSSRMAAWGGMSYSMAAQAVGFDAMSRDIPDEIWLYEQHVPSGVDLLKTLQVLDSKVFLPDVVLAKLDRASMRHSLEARVPFLDHELFELLFTLSSGNYARPPEGKWLLRRVMSSRLPGEILSGAKRGFSAPLVQPTEELSRRLLRGRLVENGIVSSQWMSNEISANGYLPWSIIALEQWVQHNASSLRMA